MAAPQRQFKRMDDVLNDINGKYIQLSQEKLTQNKKILDSVVTYFKNQLKEDPFFNAIFTNNVFYGGSTYDGLKVGKPNEFDLDFLLDLRKIAQVKLEQSNIPGFIHVKVVNPESKFSINIEKLCGDKTNYLDTGKTVRWMYSRIAKVFTKFDKISNDMYIFGGLDQKFRIKFSESGPAVTLHIYTFDGTDYYKDEDEEEDDCDKTKIMSIDLVPCFFFDSWPENGFISNPFSDRDEIFLKSFFVVPKHPRNDENLVADKILRRFWRLSFQAQERELIRDKQRLKSTVKLLKKLRDKYKDKSISSYYIKTVVLHINKEKGRLFWEKPLSEIFLQVLKEYTNYIRLGKIPYYWYKKEKYNLISTCEKQQELQIISNRLGKMLKDVERNTGDPGVIAKYLLKPTTFKKFMLVQPEAAETEVEQPPSRCTVA